MNFARIGARRYRAELVVTVAIGKRVGAKIVIVNTLGIGLPMTNPGTGDRLAITDGSDVPLDNQPFPQVGLYLFNGKVIVSRGVGLGSNTLRGGMRRNCKQSHQNDQPVFSHACKSFMKHQQARIITNPPMTLKALGRSGNLDGINQRRDSLCHTT